MPNVVCLATVAIIVLMVTGGSDAMVTCYACDTTTSTNCNDPFPSGGISSTCTGVACIKSRASYSGQTVLSRGCYPNSTATACADVSSGGASATVCFCNSDKCNAATTLKSAMHLIIGCAALILAIIALFSARLSNVCNHMTPLQASSSWLQGILS